MSVTIAQHTQPSTWWQRLTGTEPKTIVRETSTTEITNDPGGSFSVKSALRNGAIGAAVAGALGGVSLLGKVALPLIGKVGSVAGLAKLAGVGGALGIATAALPLVAPRIKESPAARAAVTGAAIGAAAGVVLPLMPISLGAAIGAGVGLLIHNRRNRPHTSYTQYPGYRAHAGFAPIGTSVGDVPNGLVPVTPNYGMYGGTAMNPYAMGMPGYPAPGYAQGQFASPYGATMSPYGAQVASPYGYGMLPATAQQVQQPVATPAAAPAATPVRRAAAKPAVRTKAKTFTDKSGNVRQVGTGKIVKPARTVAPVGTVPAGTPAPVGNAGLGQVATTDPYLAGMSATPQGYASTPQGYAGLAGLSGQPQGYAGMAATQPMGLTSPYGTGGLSTGMASAMPTATGMLPSAIPARPVA